MTIILGSAVMIRLSIQLQKRTRLLSARIAQALLRPRISCERGKERPRMRLQKFRMTVSSRSLLRICWWHPSKNVDKHNLQRIVPMEMARLRNKKKGSSEKASILAKRIMHSNKGNL